MPRRTDPWDIPAPDLRARVCTCGFDIPPHGVTPTALWVARHRVHHLDHFTPAHPTVPELSELVTAMRTLNDCLSAEVLRRQQDVADRDERIEDLEADLDAINRGVS